MFRAQGSRAGDPVIEEFLDAAAAGPMVLLLAGDPGIGKSALWQARTRQRSRSRRPRPRPPRGRGGDRPFLRRASQSCWSIVVDEVLPRLGDLRRRALEAALLLDDRGDAPVDPRAIGSRVPRRPPALSVDAARLVAVDDFQWLDSASARTLLFALRRLRDERVGALFTMRAGALELDRGLASGVAERLGVGPLGIDALFAVLRRHLGLELSRPQLKQLREVTGGNPFFALEIGRELASAPPAPGRPLRIPGTLREVVGGAAGPAAGGQPRLLLLAAASGRPTVEVLAGRAGANVRRCWPDSSTPRRPESSSSMTTECASPIRCWRRSATTRRRRGGAARPTPAWPPSSVTTRSARGTWRSRPRGRGRGRRRGP